MEQGNKFTFLYQYTHTIIIMFSWLVKFIPVYFSLLHIDLELFVTDEVRFAPAAIKTKRVDSKKAEKPMPRSKFFNMQEGKVLHYSYSIDA